MNELELIRQSFEKWYNTHIHPHTNTVINYSDEQFLNVKAYHKVTVSLIAVGIKDNLSYTIPILTHTENYNHCTTNEDEAKFNALKAFTAQLFNLASGC